MDDLSQTMMPEDVPFVGQKLFETYASRTTTKMVVFVDTCHHYRFTTRLLHAGADTRTILGQYLCAVQALLRLDPTGRLLDRIAPAICAYLRYLLFFRVTVRLNN